MTDQDNHEVIDATADDKVRLNPGYALRTADLMSPVKISEDFTLGDLCRIMENFRELDRETFSDLLQCPIHPFLEECRRPVDTDAEPRSDLLHIRLYWECEYDFLSEARWPPATSLWLHVDGIGDIWEEHRPGGRFHEPGKDYTDYNRYAVELTPLYTLRHLPLRIDPVMTVRPSITQEPADPPPLEIPAPDVTLLQLIHALFWELSFFGMPEKRDAIRTELHEQIKRIECVEERLIPFEDIRKKFDPGV